MHATSAFVSWYVATACPRPLVLDTAVVLTPCMPVSCPRSPLERVAADSYGDVRRALRELARRVARRCVSARRAFRAWSEAQHSQLRPTGQRAGRGVLEVPAPMSKGRMGPCH